MADSGGTVWAPYVWADDFWASGLWASTAGNMPQLVGVNFYMAIQALQAAGIYLPQPVYKFVPSSITVQWVTSAYPPGIVVAQSIPSGGLAAPGEEITLSVSLFPLGSNIDMPPDWRQRT